MNVSCMKAASVSLTRVLANRYVFMLTLLVELTVLSQLASSLLPGETVGQQDRKTFWKCENLL